MILSTDFFHWSERSPGTTEGSEGMPPGAVGTADWGINKNRPHESGLFLYPHAESNRNRQNRNLKFYPLNYRGAVSGCKYSKFM